MPAADYLDFPNSPPRATCFSLVLPHSCGEHATSGISLPSPDSAEYGLSGDDIMQLTSIRTAALGAAVFAGLTVGTAIAHADPPPPMPAPPAPNVPGLGDEAQNYRFMDELGKLGVVVSDGNTAYFWGTRVCLDLANGKDPDAIAEYWPGQNGGAIVTAAQQIYCPGTKLPATA
jgi:hypothetical protein